IAEEAAFKRWNDQYALLPILKDIAPLYDELKDIKDSITILSASKGVIERYDLFESGLGALETKKIDLQVIKLKHTEDMLLIDSQIKELKETLGKFDMNKVNLDLSNIRISKQQLQKLKDEAVLGMNLAVKAQEDIKGITAGLLALNKSIIKANEERETLELLKEAFSPRGIKTVIIDYMLPVLEEKINNVLSQLSDFRIRLDTQQSKIKEEEGIREGLFITVKNAQGEEMSYENFSGGEKVKITIAIAEALSGLQNSIGFRIMDENIVSLDKESTESFVEVLTKLQDKFPQLLIISHLQEIKDLFENHVIITKINGISKIKT
ncbi:MAG: hypothetical protein AABY22_18655, partial [Nanoarchaeota archaeon]